MIDSRSSQEGKLHARGVAGDLASRWRVPGYFLPFVLRRAVAELNDWRATKVGQEAESKAGPNLEEF